MNPRETMYSRIKDAVDRIRERYPTPPRLGIILGSGLGGIADLAQNRVVISYGEIHHFHATSVEGHAGQMTLGEFEGVPTVFLQGRFHVYEGYPMDEVVFPTRTICALGIHTLLLSNAAGGVNSRFRPQDLMIIEDHINLMGDNPLKGPNPSDLGPRFPDMSVPYHRGCIDILRRAAEELQIPVHQGVYAGILGPTYETPAEVRMLRVLGADAVGMSTVPECIAANHLGVRVAGVSFITNLAAGMTRGKLSHHEVIENSRVGMDKVSRLLRLAVPRIDQQKE